VTILLEDMGRIFGYAVILWIPAMLYSGCLWLLLAGFAELRHPVRARSTSEK